MGITGSAASTSGWRRPVAEAFRRPAKRHGAEIVVKQSRFLCWIAPVAGRDDAAAFVDEIRAQHPGANHNCWCYVAGTPEDYNLWNCSDDGEPRGTAGKPMLNVLTHSGLGEICVVVTRYFGGIKLGAGGLVRAYSQAVQAALAELPTEPVVPRVDCIVVLPHALTGQVEQALRQLGLEAIDRHWGERLEIRLRLSGTQRSELSSRLAPLSEVELLDDQGVTAV